MIDDFYIENTDKIDSNETDVEVLPDSLQSGVQNSDNLQQAWVSALSAEIDMIAGIDPRPPGSNVRPERKRIYTSKVYIDECCDKPDCHHKWIEIASMSEPEV